MVTTLLALLGAATAWADAAGVQARCKAELARSHDELPHDGAIRVTFLGATTLLFDDGVTQMMIDGFVSRASFWKVATGRKIRTDATLVDEVIVGHKICRLKALFVSHSHYDHALDAAYFAKQTGAHLYGSPSTCKIGSGGDLTEDQMTCFRTKVREEFVIDPSVVDGFVVTVLPSRHSPPTLFNNDIGEVIEQPLHQPAPASAYKEGFSVDFLIRHGAHTILVKPSANFVPREDGSIRANVLFLGTARLGKQRAAFRSEYYEHAVAAVAPTLVIPIHWDNFFAPLSDHLPPPHRIVDNLPAAFGFLRSRLCGIKFRIMQGHESILLFKDGSPDISEESEQTPAVNKCTK
jgi:L-ascorbate metabolism protein UlaG (beta-lactamase superfamily)